MAWALRLTPRPRTRVHHQSSLRIRLVPVLMAPHRPRPTRRPRLLANILPLLPTINMAPIRPLLHSIHHPRRLRTCLTLHLWLEAIRAWIAGMVTRKGMTGAAPTCSLGCVFLLTLVTHPLTRLLVVYVWLLPTATVVSTAAYRSSIELSLTLRQVTTSLHRSPSLTP